jgi:TonB family protein
MATWQQWEGRVINGRFPLRQYLGGSTQSAVYLTEVDGSKAAIKLIPFDAMVAQDQISRWASAGRLSHPHLLRILDTGHWHAEDEQQMLFAVMEYADENLAEVLPGRRLTPAEAKAMLLPTLDALNYLHGHGMVHGSLKPANIMAVGDELKLSSDGIRPVGKSKEFGENDNVYDAPEKEKGVISPNGDIWSLGTTLVEALTNHLPTQNRTGENDPKLPENIPEPFNDIAKHCLSWDPRCRWSTAEIRQRLERAPVRAKEDIAMQETLTVAGVLEVRAPAAQRKVPTPRERETIVEWLGATSKARVVRIASAVIVALAVIAAAVGLFHHRSKTPQPAATISARQSAASSIKPTKNASLGAFKTNTGSVDHGAVTHEVLPDVPAKAKNTITGKVNVKVKVAVDASGAVSHAVLVSRGPSGYFADQALQAARKWTFKPPGVDGTAMPSEWNLTFEFKKNGTTAVSHRISAGG